LRGLIDLHARAGNSVQVLLLCDRYLKLQPVAPEILYRKAVLLAQNGDDLAAALDTIGQALVFDERAEYLYFRGSLYLALGQYDQALADLQQVGRGQDVNSAELDMSLAEAYLGVENREQASQYLKSARRKLANGAPGNPERLERLTGRIENESGDGQ